MTLQTPVDQQDVKVEDFFPQSEGYRSVLQNPNFLALWVGQIFSQLGDRVVFVVFIAAIAVYVQQHGLAQDGLYNSYLYIAFTIPAILLTAVAGVFADRWPRRLVLVSTNALRALFVAFLPWAAEQGLMTIYVLAFLLSSATQFFVPAEAATIPMLVRKTQLLPANSLFTTTMMASIIFGFALGDPLINVFGMESVHWAIVALFVLASVVLLVMQTPPPAVEAKEDRTVGDAISRFFDELKEGIAYIRENRLVLNLLLKLALLFSTIVAICFLFINFAKAYLYTDPEVASRKFAYIITYSGIGMAVGAMLVGKYFCGCRRRWLVFGGFMGAGLFISLLALTGFIPQSAAAFTTPAIALDWIYLDPITMTFRMLYTYTLATVMGVSAAFIAIPIQALIHEMIPEDKRGKVMGVQFTILSTASTLPAVAADLGAHTLGPHTMVLLIGLPLLGVGLYGLFNQGWRQMSGDDPLNEMGTCGAQTW